MTGLQPAPEATGTDVPALLHPFTKPSLSSQCFVAADRRQHGLGRRRSARSTNATCAPSLLTPR